MNADKIGDISNNDHNISVMTIPVEIILHTEGYGDGILAIVGSINSERRSHFNSVLNISLKGGQVWVNKYQEIFIKEENLCNSIL